MNINEKVDKFIENLQKLTHSGSVKWSRLPTYINTQDNEILKRKILFENQSFYSSGKNYFTYNRRVLNELSSFCALYNNGIICLFQYDNYHSNDKRYIITIQNSIDGNIASLNNDDSYQVELKTLSYYINEKFDNYEELLDSVINLEN